MGHVELARWVDIIEKNDPFTPDERAHVGDCSQCQNLLLVLARLNRDETLRRDLRSHGKQ